MKIHTPFEVTLLHANVPTNSGKTYPPSALEAIADRINAGNAPIFVQTDVIAIDLNNMCGQVKDAKIVDGILTAIVHVLPNLHMGKHFNELLTADKDRVQFQPIGYGNIAEDGTVTDYQYHYVSVNFN